MAPKLQYLSKNEFIKLIPHLPLNELTSIEFKRTKWQQLINWKKDSKHLHQCCVCQMYVRNLYAHMEDKKHIWKMQAVQEFYHPLYTHPKVVSKADLTNNSSSSIGKPRPATKLTAETSIGKVKANVKMTEKKFKEKTNEKASSKIMAHRRRNRSFAGKQEKNARFVKNNTRSNNQTRFLCESKHFKESESIAEKRRKKFIFSQGKMTDSKTVENIQSDIATQILSDFKKRSIDDEPISKKQKKYFDFSSNPLNLQIDKETHKLMVDEFLKKARSRITHGKSEIMPSYGRNDAWQAHQDLLEETILKLDELFHFYRKYPDKHPSYESLWKLFYNRRKLEVTKAGLDYRTYDYKPEWAQFFEVRIEELYKQSVAIARDQLSGNFTMEKHELPVSEDLVNKTKNMINYNSSTNIDQYNKGRNNFDEEKRHVLVSTLRLLTGLEDYLGSLGPKIFECLTKALLVEKTNPCNLNSLMLNDEVSALLLMIMEKFKGLLEADVLELSTEFIIKNAIENIKLVLFPAEDKTQPELHDRSQFEVAIHHNSNKFVQNVNDTTHILSYVHSQVQCM